MREGRSRPTISQLRRRVLVVAGSALLVMSCGSDAKTVETVTTGTSSTTTTSTSSTTSTSTTSPRKSTTTSSTVARCLERLEKGCEGEAVKRLQRLLRTRINAGVAVDGSFGGQTEGALRSFEQFQCPATTCTVDGRIVVDGPEWKALEKLPELTKPTFEPSP